MVSWSDIETRCPECSQPLSWSTSEFRCANGHGFPVRDGVPRFVHDGSYAEAFGYEWNRHRRTQVDNVAMSRSTLEEKTGLTPVELAGRLVLDVGVGAGRFAVVAAEAGATVVGVDLTSAAEVAAENLARRGLIAQADLFHLPFPDETFDVVYSIGVLHHTPDTRAAVEVIARYVKPGGTLAVWLYHPFRRYVISDTLRLVTTRLPAPALHRIIRLATRLPIGRFVPMSEEVDHEARVLGTFDWYAPHYQWKHRPEEVVGWFRELGFEDIRVLPFVTGVRGRSPAASR
jgi:ubiquinone/menaquinone biosynthesis C-methylase UbiE